jgi:hypothetical protein
MEDKEFRERLIGALETLVELMTPEETEPTPEPEESPERKAMEQFNYEMARKTAINVLGKDRVEQVEDDIKEGKPISPIPSTDSGDTKP